jgi:hypothetical protein
MSIVGRPNRGVPCRLPGVGELVSRRKHAGHGVRYRTEQAGNLSGLFRQRLAARWQRLSVQDGQSREKRKGQHQGAVIGKQSRAVQLVSFPFLWRFSPAAGGTVLGIREHLE